MFSMYFFCEMVTLWSFIVISMPTILDGSPSSVICHSDLMSSVMATMAPSDEANNSKSLTHIVIIATPLWLQHMYTHGSDSSCVKPCFVTLLSNSIFHSLPACFKPYNILMRRHILLVPSWHPSG